MAKISVLKGGEDERSPFLRGILVQSLVQSGLGFADAYDLAREIRNGLHDVQEIASNELRSRVAGLLEQRHGREARERYEAEPADGRSIIVHTPARSVPFSVGVLAHSLETCAIAPDMAMEGARKVLATLRKTGHPEIDHKALRRIIYRCLHEHCSPAAADRYLSWRRFENSGIPLIVLVGGVTGSGKRAVSSELAYRLDITHHQSTDMMREIIRSYLSPQMVPTLTYPSFEAWRGLPGGAGAAGPAIERPVIAGFLSQLSAMKLALEATIDRAVEERHHLILEGVHVIPTELKLPAEGNNAVVIPIMIASMKKKQLKKQLERHGLEKGDRLVRRYVEGLDDVWELQSWILDEADRDGIDIVESDNIEAAVRKSLDLIIGRIMKHFPPESGEEVWNA